MCALVRNDTVLVYALARNDVVLVCALARNDIPLKLAGEALPGKGRGRKWFTFSGKGGIIVKNIRFHEKELSWIIFSTT